MPCAAFLAGVGSRPGGLLGAQDPQGTGLLRPRPPAAEPAGPPDRPARQGASRLSELAEQAYRSLRAIPLAVAPPEADAAGGSSRAGLPAPDGRVAVPVGTYGQLEGETGGLGSEAPETDRQSALRSVVASALRVRHRIKSPEELQVEAEIESVYREYFREYSIGGNTITVRMPFGLNGEREGGRGYSQSFYLGGKGTPRELWPQVDSVFTSRRFADYLEALNEPSEKVIILDLERRSYGVSRDPELTRSLSAGPSSSYPGSPTRIFVYRSTPGASAADLYNYLYAVAAVGVDCSGLVYHVHRTIALARGLDLDRQLAGIWRIRPGQVRYRIGLWFYDPAAGFTETVDDRIENLRPADILLFEGSDGSFKHSAVIQSIDFEKGLIRYVQATDWALQPERGVHESLVRFDPARPEVDLRHYSVRWLQQVRPPFDGEIEPRDWLDDGDRYLWYMDAGGSRVVRLKSLAAVFTGREPRFYANLYRDEGTTEENAAAPPQSDE